MHVCIFIFYTQVHSTHCMGACAYKYTCGSLIQCLFQEFLTFACSKWWGMSSNAQFTLLLWESLEKGWVTGMVLFFSALILKHQVELFCKDSLHKSFWVFIAFFNGKCVCSFTFIFRFFLLLGLISWALEFLYQAAFHTCEMLHL